MGPDVRSGIPVKGKWFKPGAAEAQVPGCCNCFSFGGLGLRKVSFGRGPSDGDAHRPTPAKRTGSNTKTMDGHKCKVWVANVPNDLYSGGRVRQTSNFWAKLGLSRAPERLTWLRGQRLKPFSGCNLFRGWRPFRL